MSGLQNARSPERADYDWRGFAILVRARLSADGSGYRALAGTIGVTFTDLSRAASGQMIAVHKVIAICDWLGVDIRRFYLPPEQMPAKSGCCSASNVKRTPASRAAEEDSRHG
ncbi:hypothetical protein GRZ55_11310 [Chelativorans sp. ZYF759]|uniref:hypothetical protein n=1 Tax=Chelativorans sp. ZYF759 TaxID=2692213 RepID=UPI00145E00F4|nr:hypothetical protein [Chelativorans sp. ZYF759]NMG39832.1 hypothetical protein [Chelativorans sp. ZYF759]